MTGRKPIRSFLAGFVLFAMALLIGLQLRGFAGNQPDQPESPKEQIAELTESLSRLAGVKAYSSKGTVEITFSDALLELLEDWGVPKRKKCRFEIQAKGQAIWEKGEEIASDGSVGQSLIQIQDASSYTRYDVGSAFAAISTKNPRPADEGNLRDVSFPFVGYAFLSAHSDGRGFAEVTPAVLNDTERWREILSLPGVSVSSKAEGSVHVEFRREKYLWAIVFARPSFAPNRLVPAAVRLSIEDAGKVYLLRDLRVDEFNNDPQIGPIPRKLTIKVFRGPTDEKVPAENLEMALFNVEISEFNVNPDDK